MEIYTPLCKEVVSTLKTGEIVYLSGTLLTARDAAHQRLVKTLKMNKEIPVELEGAVIYYVGPCPAPPNHVIGSAGPTTSGRMDPFTPLLLKQGLRGMIGKGPRSQEVQDAMRKHRSIYFLACGGAGALIAKHVEDVSIVAYKDLGPEAIHKLTVKRLPLIVAYDTYGRDIFQKLEYS